MVIHRKKLALNHIYKESGNVTFGKDVFLRHSNLRNIENCHIDLAYVDNGDILNVAVKVEADLTLVCAYSLEDVPFHVKMNDKIEFTAEEKLSSGDIFYEPRSAIDLDPYIFGLILTSIPIRVIKKGAKLPADRDCFRFLNEDDLEKERKKEKESPFDALEDLEI